MTDIKRVFRTRKEQQIANKFKKFASAKLATEALQNCCESCRQKAVSKVMNGKIVQIEDLCQECAANYKLKLKKIVEEEFGGELYDGNNRI